MHFTLKNMDPLFLLLEECCGVPQLHIHHPEGDVFTHSMQVLNLAFRETNDTDLILAAMLHDVGKICTRKGHEEVSVTLIKDHVSQKTISIVENHMRIWTYILGDMKRLGKAQFFANHPYLPEMIQMARWDKMGRKPKWYPWDSVTWREDIVLRLNRAWEKQYPGMAALNFLWHGGEK